MSESALQVTDFQHGRVPRAVRERQLLELAEELFAERGYAGTSMDELCRRAGVTKPVVYELFGSKDGPLPCLPRGLRVPPGPGHHRRRARAVGRPRPSCAPGARPSCASRPTTGWPGRCSSAPARDALPARPTPSASNRPRCFAGCWPRRRRRASTRDSWTPSPTPSTAPTRPWGTGPSDQPDLPLETLADWLVSLLAPGLRSFT